MRFFLILTTIVLSACSSVYHEKDGWVPEGYMDKRLSDKEYVISFQTYKGESWEEIESYLLLRAAEVGKLNGFSFFSIIDTKKEEKTEVQSTREVVGTHTVGRDGNVSITGPIVPQYSNEYNIRTLTSTAVYSNEQNIREYNAEHVISDILTK